jgi:hypothetical protein
MATDFIDNWLRKALAARTNNPFDFFGADFVGLDSLGEGHVPPPRN